MVNLLPTTAQIPITVTLADVDTTLTITAPASVAEGELFIASGKLTRNDTGAPVIGEVVRLRYNGIEIGVDSTDANGDWWIEAAIPAAGAWILTAFFAGVSYPGLTLNPSSAGAPIRLDGLDPLVLLALLGGAAYILTRK